DDLVHTPSSPPDDMLKVTKRGRQSAMWSPHVVKLADVWSEAIRSILMDLSRLGAYGVLGGASDDPLTDSEAEQLKKFLKEAVQVAWRTELQLREQIWRELRGEDRGHLPVPEE